MRVWWIRFIFTVVYLTALSAHPALAHSALADRFTYMPWEMTTALDGQQIAVPDAMQHGFPTPLDLAQLRPYVIERFPSPDPRWRPASDLRTVWFHQKSGITYPKVVVCYYFRTVLNVPRAVDPRAVYLTCAFHGFDGLYQVLVNGQIVPNDSAKNNAIRLGDSLHDGPNSVLIRLAVWVDSAILEEVRFLTGSENGLRLASLSTDPSLPDAESSSPSALPLHTDDWLRPHRDGGNTAHSTDSLRLPLEPMWDVPIAATDVRIWDDTVLAGAFHGEIRSGFGYETETLIALDLKTGRELWCLPYVVLGDVTADGGVAVLASSQTPFLGESLSDEGRVLALLDVRSGRLRWQRDAPGAVGPLVVDRDVLYLSSRLLQADGGLTRLNVHDGSLIATTTAPGVGWVSAHQWASPGFTEDEVFFGDTSWLYALYLPDPQRGPKYYGGGFIAPLVAGDYVVTGGWGGVTVYQRNGKGLKAMWGHPAGYDTARSGVPIGPSGAVLIGLTMLDLVTGNILWHAETIGNAAALTAGKQVISDEEHRLPSSRGATEPTPTHRLLVVRDAATGRRLWESEAMAGTPLAASRGCLLVATQDRLRCYR